MIIHINGSNHNREEIGNKAYNLTIISKLGINVPEAIFLPRRLLIGEYTNCIIDLCSRLEELLPSNAGWAIRSSSIFEDTSNASNAGKFKTIVIKKANELLEAVEDILNSDLPFKRMGIIIQKFIESDYAGVAFSFNPQTLESGVVIEVAPGRGEFVVNGLVNPYTFKNGRWVTEVPDIPEYIISGITATVELLKEHFSYEVDVEFCVSNNIIHWLQVRPVTTKSLNKIEPGEWVLLDQCTDPIPSLIQDLDPSGIFNSLYWETIFHNNYPYIRYKKDLESEVHNKNISYFKNWKEIKSYFEPIFDEYYRDVDLSNYSLQQLWSKLGDRIEFYKRYVKTYLSREWMQYRRKLGQKIRDVIRQAYKNNELLNVEYELSKITSGLDTITTKKSKKFRELINKARQFDQVETILSNREKYQSHPLVILFEEFIAEYGYEIPSAVHLHLPTLKEAPNELIAQIVSLVSTVSTNESDKNNEYCDEWEFHARKIQEQLNTLEEKEMFFENLQNYRELLIRTEDDDYLLYKGAAWIRNCIVTIGQNLEQNKIIDNYEDIFHLSLEELITIINNQKFASIQFKNSINARKRLYFLFRDINPSIVLSSEEQGKFITLVTSNDGHPKVHGIGVSRGAVEGIVFQIKNTLDRSSYSKIPKNSIIVAPVLSPSLTYNLINVKGVITEVGGFLSHGAIFAREMNIPAIVGVSNALKILKNGMRVRINGDVGEITIMEGI